MEYINDLLKVEVQDYVALVTIDHPPLNILTLKLSAQMRDTLHCPGAGGGGCHGDGRDHCGQTL